MIGPFAAVLLHAAAKFRIGHQKNTSVPVIDLELAEKVCNGGAEREHQIAVLFGLAGMRVETVDRHIEDSRPQSFANEPGNDFEFLVKVHLAEIVFISSLTKTRTFIGILAIVFQCLSNLRHCLKRLKLSALDERSQVIGTTRLRVQIFQQFLALSLAFRGR